MVFKISFHKRLPLRSVDIDRRLATLIYGAHLESGCATKGLTEYPNAGGIQMSGKGTFQLAVVHLLDLGDQKLRVLCPSLHAPVPNWGGAQPGAGGLDLFVASEIVGIFLPLHDRKHQSEFHSFRLPAPAGPEPLSFHKRVQR